jgi:hypothetical protein
LQNSARPRQEFLSDRSEPHTRARSLEEWRAQTFFQIANPAAEIGLLKGKRFGRLAKTTVPSGSLHIAQVSQLYGRKDGGIAPFVGSVPLRFGFSRRYIWA